LSPGNKPGLLFFSGMTFVLFCYPALGNVLFNASLVKE
jgi:hypothetical protein